MPSPTPIKRRSKLIRLNLLKCAPIHHWEDCQRIISVLAAHGLEARPEEAQRVWEEISNRGGYEWQEMPLSDNRIWEAIREIVEYRRPDAVSEAKSA